MRAALLVGLLALAPPMRAEVGGPPARLSGTVRDAGGQPVAGAVVTLRSRAQGLCHALASAETDAQGR
jgi:hypothetical protein